MELGVRFELTMEQMLVCLQGRCNRPDYENPAKWYRERESNPQNPGSEPGMYAQFHHPGVNLVAPAGIEPTSTPL